MPVITASVAPAPSAAAPTPSPGSVPVAALLVLDHPDPTIPEVVAAIAAQEPAPARLVIVDTSADGTAAAEVPTEIHDRLPVTVEALPGGSLRTAVQRALETTSEPAVWALTGRTAPDPGALGALHDAVFGARQAALAGAKLCLWDRPNRLYRFGIQATRTGRLLPSPRRGQPDQQQFDDRREALAVPIEGTLLRCSAIREIGGVQPAFAGPAADLDLGWRARQAGHRVTLAPRARVRVAGTPTRAVTGAERRGARRVALARCPLLVMPLLWSWVLVSSLAGALVRLLLKRPRGAALELTDLGALLDPWQPLRARWRTRHRSHSARREVRAAAVGSRAVLRRWADRTPDLLLPGGSRPPVEAAAPDHPAGGGALTSPLPWLLLVATVAMLAAGRTLDGGLLGGLRHGFTGGELAGSTGTARTLWHAVADGWRGAGLGTANATSPGLAVLAGLTWLWQHLPVHEAGANPLAGLLGAILVLAAPAAALSAYLSGRCLTHRRWPRALAGLAWAATPPAATAIGEGRLGAVAFLVLLPPTLAGARALTTSPRTGIVAAAALPAALLASVVPGTLVLVALLALVLALTGVPRTRLRAGGYLLATALAAAPVVPLLRERPARLLTGWGLLTAPQGHTDPVAVALLHPGALGASTGLDRVGLWLTAPLVVLGLLALLRRKPPSGPAWFAGFLVLVGLAAALILPRVTLVAGPGLPPVSGWAGTGLLLAIAGLLAAGLYAVDASGPRWRWAAPTAGALAVAATLAGLVLTGLGTALHPAQDQRPAVAVDQARGPAAGRSVLIDLGEDQVGYALLGRESGIPARDLAGPTTRVSALDDAIGELTATTGGGAAAAASTLADWGVGYLLIRRPVPDAVEHRLDATAHLARVGDQDDALVWRIDADTPGQTEPSRLRLVAGHRTQLVPSTGSHAATRTRLQVPADAVLDVAEPRAWAQHAVVTANGARLTAIAGGDAPAYALPAGPVDLTVAVTPTSPRLRWAYAALLLLLVYLAVPLGKRPGAGVWS